MTFEEKVALMEAGMEALEKGNGVLADQLFRQIPLPPHMGRGLAEIIGYEEAVARGVNFEEVEATYGPNWHASL